MRAIEVLDKLHDSGDLIELAKAGLVSTSILLYRKVYHAYQFQLLNGVKKTQAITDIGDVFGISERMVYRIINKFK